MDTKILVALIGAAATIAAAVATAILKGRKDVASSSDTSSVHVPTNHVSVVGNMTDNIIGCSGVVIDRSQHNVTVAASGRRAANLSIVDVSTDSWAQTGCATIEIKVRNPSDEIIFLKRAELEVLGQWNIPQIGNPYAVPVSWSYDAEISPGRAVVNLSQAIEPNHVDRFEIKVGCKTVEGKYPFKGLFLYLIRLTIQYNEMALAAECPRVLIHVPCPMDIQGYSMHGPEPDKELRNKKLAQEVLDSIGNNTIVEPQLLENIHSWADADLPGPKE